MKRNVTECDRCGREVGRGGRQIAIKAHHDTNRDLCERCFSAFESFMEKDTGQGSGVPRGYKRVARDCPHYVPCAEPACSGYELVPA